MQGRWLVVVVAALAVASCGAVGPRGPMRHFRRAVNLRRRQLAPVTAGERSLPGSMSLIETIMRAGVTMADAAYLPTAYNVAEVMSNASNYVEHVVVEGEDIDTLAHNFYFGDHWKAMDLLLFNIQLTRAKAGAHDFAVGDKVVIPKPIRSCKDGWRASGGPRKMEQHCGKVLAAAECDQAHGKMQEDGICECDIRCLGNLKCSDYKDWVPEEAQGNHPRAGWGPIEEAVLGPTGMSGSESESEGAKQGAGGEGGSQTPFWSGALKLLGKKNTTAMAAKVGGGIQGNGTVVKGDAEYCLTAHKTQDTCNADTRCTWQSGTAPNKCIAATKVVAGAAAGSGSGSGSAVTTGAPAVVGGGKGATAPAGPQ